MALLGDKKVDDALNILESNCFPTYASFRTIIRSLWYDGVVMRESIKLGRDLNRSEAHKVRRANPVPENIGCVYGEDFCLEYW